MRALRREAGLQIALVALSLFVVLPFLWVLAASFRSQINLLMGEFWFEPTLTAYREVLFSRTSTFLHNARNSLVVGLASTALSLLAATLGAWSLHRMAWPRWWVHLLLLWALVLQMIPPVALAGGWFVMARAVGLDNTLLGLVLAHATLNLPMALWMMGVYVRDVPQELVEAARLDGASTPVLLRRVVLPLVAPGLAAAGVLCFVFSWNEFAAALNLTMRQTATVPVSIAKFAQEFEIRYVEMAAAASLSAVPALLLLLLAQRWIVKGLTLGAVK
jgi:multiple sugar transport system permease protein